MEQNDEGKLVINEGGKEVAEETEMPGKRGKDPLKENVLRVSMAQRVRWDAKDMAVRMQEADKLTSTVVRQTSVVKERHPDVEPSSDEE